MEYILGTGRVILRIDKPERADQQQRLLRYCRRCEWQNAETGIVLLDNTRDVAAHFPCRGILRPSKAVNQWIDDEIAWLLRRFRLRHYRQQCICCFLDGLVQRYWDQRRGNRGLRAWLCVGTGNWGQGRNDNQGRGGELDFLHMNSLVEVGEVHTSRPKRERSTSGTADLFPTEQAV